jgi:hypothetical protein
MSSRQISDSRGEGRTEKHIFYFNTNPTELEN